MSGEVTEKLTMMIKIIFNNNYLTTCQIYNIKIIIKKFNDRCQHRSIIILFYL